MTQQTVFMCDNEIEDAKLDITTDYHGIFDKRCQVTHITESVDSEGKLILIGQATINKQLINVHCFPTDSLEDNDWSLRNI